MDRRDFLKKTMMAAAGAAAAFVSPDLIDDEFLYSPKELFSTDLYSLERAVMVGEIVTNENPKSLINLCNELNQKPRVDIETERIKGEIREILISKSRQFSRKTPSMKNLEEARDEIGQRNQEIRQIQEGEKITFVVKRGVFVSSQEDLKPGDSALKEFYKFGNYISLIDSLIRNGEASPQVQKLYKTLTNLSPDSSLISWASKSGIPIEEIVAFADVESNGNPFAIGRNGEITAFQLNPRYLTDICNNALSRRNILSDYIQENASKKTLLEDLAGNSKLNIAVAVNFMKYLKEKTGTDYEYVLAYNMGLRGILELSQRTRRKLENPAERISEQDKKRSVFGYYTSFLDSKRAFEQIRSHITQGV